MKSRLIILIKVHLYEKFKILRILRFLDFFSNSKQKGMFQEINLFPSSSGGTGYICTQFYPTERDILKCWAAFIS
jgi:hypothetical protein